jgi:type VI secretion system protein VasI
MFFRFTALCAILSITATMAVAHGECADVSDTSERLSCFDDAHGIKTALTSDNPPEKAAENTIEPEPAPIKVDWNTRTKTNPLTDLTDVYLSVRANETIQCGYKEERPMLFLRCMDNTTAVLFVTDCFMADIQGYGKVRYRVDKNTEKTRNFEESTDNMSLGLWSYNRARPFIDHLRGGEKLIMQYTPYNDSPKMTTFDIAGLDEALKPLRKECGW